MTMFTAAQVEAMNQNSAEQHAAAEQHMAETHADVPQTVAEIIAMVQHVEGDYETTGDYGNTVVLPWYQIVAVLRDAEKYRVSVAVKHSATDRNLWYIELSNDQGYGFGQYHFVGH